MIRRFVVLAILVASVMSAMPSSYGHHYVAIQPGVERTGTRISGEPGTFACTYNFVFTDKKGRRYIGIAGHCTGFGVTEVGQVMYVTDVGRIGTVVWKAPLPTTRPCGELVPPEGAEPCIDFALVRIDEALYGHIDPAVRYWGGPTGMVPFEEIEAGMLMHHYGYGDGFHASELSRPRTGVVLGTLGCGYRVAFPFAPHDSGSPQIAGDGRALGIMTGAEGGGAFGLSMDCIMDAASDAGLRINLATAPFNGDAGEREKHRFAHVVSPHNLGRP